MLYGTFYGMIYGIYIEVQQVRARKVQAAKNRVASGNV